MYSERLQLLLSPEQRRLLEREAKRRGTSVAGVVRDAIEAQLGGPTPAARRQAFERIVARRAAFLTPEQINRLVEEEREARLSSPPAAGRP